ncbi:hypothetical protein LCGC14_2888860, partial [marine sediment metagenome]
LLCSTETRHELKGEAQVNEGPRRSFTISICLRCMSQVKKGQPAPMHRVYQEIMGQVA